jgi:adenylate cyclase
VEQGTVMAIRINGLQRWQESVEPLRALGVIHALYAAAQSGASAFGGRLEQAQGHLLMVAWPDSRAHEAGGNGPLLAAAAARRCLKELQPLLDRNESELHPLSMNIAIESGPYLHGIVGHAESRSALLLGPAVADVQGMLELSDELACPILMGPAVAAQLKGDSANMQRMGRFTLPSQAEPKDLFRLQTLNGLNSSAAQG